MQAFVFALGRRWPPESVRWSLGRLEHLGLPTRMDSPGDSTLHAFGEPPRSSRLQASWLWTWGLTGVEHEHLARLVRRDAITRESLLPYPSAVVLLHDVRRGGILVYVGVDARIPVRYARQGRSLWLAPEAKAFSDLSSRGRIEELHPGSLLRFDPATKAVVVERAVPRWQEIPMTELDYEAAQGEVERLVLEGMRHLGQEHAGPLPLALSGGLDSSIVAWAAHRTGVACEAFTVWFDAGLADPPPDLEGARLTAEALHLPLVELRIGAEEIEELAKESVFFQEETYWRHVETGAYVLRLLKELKVRGHRILMTGLNGDGNFAGMVFRRQMGERFQEGMAANRRYRFAMSRLAQKLGFALVSLFDHEPLRDFSLRLPPEYLVEEIDGKLVGKKILRDLYADRMASPLASRRKDYPFNTSGSEALFEREWGPRDARERRYAQWMEELLTMPRFRNRTLRARILRGLRPG